MNLSSFDPVLKYIPSIKKPDITLSFKEKLKWTAVILGIYFFLFSTPALGVNIPTINQPSMQLISVIFASRIGYLTTVGIGPIVLSSMILQLIMGSGAFKIDMNDPENRGRFQGIQKMAALAIAFVEAIMFVNAGYAPLSSPAFYWLVILQLSFTAVLIIYLDEAMTKWGISSGINLFIAGGVAYSIVAGTSTILLTSALAALKSGGATALPNAILAFGPLFAAIAVFFISTYIFNIKVELPMVFSQFRGVGGKLPLPLLYVSVMPVILTYALLTSLGLYLTLLAHVTGPLAVAVHLFATYNTSGASSTPILTGGLLYLVSPNFPQPYSTIYGGIGNYGTYFSYFFNTTIGGTIRLEIPGGPVLHLPQWVHIITYTLVFVPLCVLFGLFWVEMTGENPQSVAEQLQQVGWQIPGFRRDPRIIKEILDKYIPAITVLGSIVVALLAVFATLAGSDRLRGRDTSYGGNNVHDLPAVRAGEPDAVVPCAGQDPFLTVPSFVSR